jgi:hypothetical protein
MNQKVKQQGFLRVLWLLHTPKRLRCGQARIWIKIRSQTSGSDQKGPDTTGSGSAALLISNVAEPHHFYAGLAPGKNFDATSAHMAPAPTLLYSKPTY